MPLLTQNVLGAPGHQWPNFDGFIYIHYAAPPYSARINAIYTPPVWQRLIVFRLLRATPGNEPERKIHAGWVKSPV